MFRVFQSVRGLADDSVTRLDKNEDLALEMKMRFEIGRKLLRFGVDAINFIFEKSRNVLAREDASGDSGSEFEGFR